MWCIQEELLCSMYHLQHSPPSQLQDEAIITNGFIPVLEEFKKHIEDEKVKLAIKDLRSKTIEWLPKYGAAILGRPTIHGEYHLSVIGLDKWEFVVHSSPQGRSHTAYSSGYSIAFAMNTEAQWGDLIQKFRKIFSKAIQNTGNKRSAYYNEQGHQKTPAFIYAVLNDAITQIQVETEHNLTKPRGGFTDVGLHTGGLPRDTSWPLVTSLLQVFLEAYPDGQERFRTSMAYFDLWLAEHQAALVVANNLHFKYINATIQMLRAAAEKQVQTQEFATRCLKVRKQLETCGNPTCSIKSEPADIEYIEIHVADELHGETKQSFKDVCSRSRTNIDYVNLLPDGATFQSALQWVKSTKKNNITKRLISHSIERLFFLSSNTLKDNTHILCTNTSELEAIDQLIINEYTSVDKSAAARSRRTLVIWIAFCLTYQATSKLYPLLQKYGSPLCYEDLRHLVLGEKLAIEALVHVSAYLSNKQERPVFCIRTKILSETHTFDLAYKFSESSEQIMTEYQRHVDDSENRDTVYWKEVEAKRAKIAEYTLELTELRNYAGKLPYPKSPIRPKGYDHYSYYRRNSEVYNSEEGIEYRKKEVKYNMDKRVYDEAHENVREMERRIEAEAVYKTKIVHPLPKKQKHALEIMFFLHMPYNFKILGKLSFLAQHQIIPDSQLCNMSFKTNWIEFFNSNKKQGSYGYQPPVLLMSQQVPPNNKSPTDVRKISPESNGIYYPDNLFLCLGWNEDGKRSYVNPFEYPLSSTIVEHYTEELGNQALQWIMPQYGDNSENTKFRGNQGITSQHLKPFNFTKPQFLEFTSLRAYPYTQLRKLCTSLRILPLGETLVQTVIKQLLYHIGEIACIEGKPKLLWKKDQIDYDLLKVLFEELERLADIMQSAPSKY